MSPQETAWEMMKSKDFQNTKCEHGGPDESPIFSVHVPKLNPSYSNQAFRIQNGEMIFTRLVSFSRYCRLELNVPQRRIAGTFQYTGAKVDETDRHAAPNFAEEESE